MKSDGKFDVSKLYLSAVIVCGAIVFCINARRFDLSELGIGYLIFGVITVAFASRISVRIPGVKGHISLSDTFIFLSILIFGGEAAVILASIDAVFSSYRVTKKWMTLLFNIAVFIISTFVTVAALRFCFGSMRFLAHREISADFVAAVCLMGIVQYVMNSVLVAAGCALRTRQPILQIWKDNFLWAALTSLAGASAAGMTAKLIDSFGIYALLAVTPVVAVFYFTYTTYLKNVEAATEKAELAQKHVEELSLHIAEQERISRALKESEEYFRNAFDHAAGMALIQPNGKWIQVNDSLCKMLGFTEEELLKESFQAITHTNDLEKDLANLYKLLNDKIPNYQLEKRYSHKNGDDVWVLQSASLIRDADCQPRHVILQIQDISDRKKAEQVIHHAAFHDALTGLPNRSLFADRLSMAIERAKCASDYLFAVVFVDLDRFKIVNDSLGHNMGDKLLVDLSRRVEKCVRSVDTIARLGGDEFAILLDGISKSDDAVEIADRIQAALQAEPFMLGGHEFFTTASIGIAYSATGYERPEDILRDADTAMYRAKANGKARYEVFDNHMRARAVDALTLENELRHALENGEIVPHYQSIVSLETGEITGFEALARWEHPQRGLISPAEFIPMAEETGLIVPLGISILRQACRQIHEWQKTLGCPDLTISVNLSGRQFRQADLVEAIEKVLFETGLRPHSLRLEITETIVMDNTAAAVEMLRRLKTIGVQLAVDDFGTGYSSLSYLHRFPFDILKIDRSFVSRMAIDRESRGIVRTIAALAAELGKEVVAEGVETEAHRDALLRLSCRYGQGFLFSKPINSEAAEKLLRDSMIQTVISKETITFQSDLLLTAAPPAENLDSSFYFSN